MLKKLFPSFLLTSESLKYLGWITMVSDHVGVFFFPEYTILRILGRMSFPIFVFFIIEGFHKTSHFKRYLTRLLVCALISQIPYALLVPIFRLNAIFSLTLILIALKLWKSFFEPRTSNALVKVLFWLGFAAIAETLKFEYGAYGLLLGALLENIPDQKGTLWTWSVLWVGLHASLFGYQKFAWYQSLVVFFPMLLIHFSWVKPTRRIGYWLYPAHLAAIKIITLLLKS